MSYRRIPVTTNETIALRWYAMPAIMAAVLVSTLVVAGTTLPADATALRAPGSATPQGAIGLPASPAPGEGAPVLVAGQTPPPY